MKQLPYFLGILLLTILSGTSFAKKIVITGNPVVITQNGNVYTLPAGFTLNAEYYYVTVDGVNKVCFSKPQADLKELPPTLLQVNNSGKTITWSCYNYDAQYFVIH